MHFLPGNRKGSGDVSKNPGGHWHSYPSYVFEHIAAKSQSWCFLQRLNASKKKTKVLISIIVENKRKIRKNYSQICENYFVWNLAKIRWNDLF